MYTDKRTGPRIIKPIEYILPVYRRLDVPTNRYELIHLES